MKRNHNTFVCNYGADAKLFCYFAQQPLNTVIRFKELNEAVPLLSSGISVRFKIRFLLEHSTSWGILVQKREQRCLFHLVKIFLSTLNQFFNDEMVRWPQDYISLIEVQRKL